MIKVYDTGNYFTLIPESKPPITRTKAKIEFILNEVEGVNLFSILIDGKSIEYLSNKPYTDFIDLEDNPFADLETFTMYVFENTGCLGAGFYSETNPVPITTGGTQSTIVSYGAGEVGTFSLDCEEIYIANTGKTSILIDGEEVKAGISFPWVGSFTYDTQVSSLLIIYVQ